MDKTRHLWTLPLLTAALALGGCFDRTNTVEVKIIKSDACDACGSSPDPMQDVTHLRVRFVNDTRCGPVDEGGVRHCQVNGGQECEADEQCGFGSSILDRVVQVGAGSLPFEQIQAGVPMTVQIAGFAGSPPDGIVLSFGRSAPFTVPVEKSAGQPASTALVFFRPVERFSPVNLASDPSVRTTLSAPRAGHTATLLDDGRVLIAGGFDTTGASGASLKDSTAWTYQESVEIFDPLTGAISTEAPPMNRLGRNTPRAFHSAVKLPSNQVLIAGGEYATRSSGKSVMNTASDSTILYDPTIDSAGGWVTQPSSVKRSRQVAVVEQSNKVLLFGGLFWDGTSTNVPTYNQGFEWYNPDVNAFTRLETSAQGPLNTAAGHAGIPLYGGKYIGFAGGSRLDTGTTAKMNQDRAVRFFMYNSTANKMQEQAFIGMSVPRTYPALAGQGARYIITGGFQSFDPAKWWDLFPTNPYSGTDILDLKGPGNQPQILMGPSLDVPRGHACAVTLQDGRMMVVGGRGGQTTLGSIANSGFFVDDGDENPAVAFTFEKGDDLEEARFFHTCTLLLDGSVLVTGGVQEKGSEFVTLSSVEIFVPRPPAD
ncbi:MAG: hypothetical protein HY901_06445 [Deltaproteobacteria bacterium]|nr:hypothetical protein [Deltaproteobacteria bacterium]